MCYALHRKVSSQRTSGVQQHNIPELGKDEGSDRAEILYGQHNNSGLSQEERLGLGLIYLCLI